MQSVTWSLDKSFQQFNFALAFCFGFLSLIADWSSLCSDSAENHSEVSFRKGISYSSNLAYGYKKLHFGYVVIVLTQTLNNVMRKKKSERVLFTSHHKVCSFLLGNLIGLFQSDRTDVPGRPPVSQLAGWFNQTCWSDKTGEGAELLSKTSPNKNK